MERLDFCDQYWINSILGDSEFFNASKFCYHWWRKIHSDRSPDGAQLYQAEKRLLPAINKVINYSYSFAKAMYMVKAKQTLSTLIPVAPPGYQSHSHTNGSIWRINFGHNAQNEWETCGVSFDSRAHLIVAPRIGINRWSKMSNIAQKEILDFASSELILKFYMRMDRSPNWMVLKQCLRESESWRMWFSRRRPGRNLLERNYASVYCRLVTYNDWKRWSR